MKQNRLVSRLPFLFLIAKVHGITRRPPAAPATFAGSRLR